jgi:hypothetical protein
MQVLGYCLCVDCFFLPSMRALVEQRLLAVLGEAEGGEG